MAAAAWCLAPPLPRCVYTGRNYTEKRRLFRQRSSRAWRARQPVQTRRRAVGTLPPHREVGSLYGGVKVVAGRPLGLREAAAVTATSYSSAPLRWRVEALYSPRASAWWHGPAAEKSQTRPPIACLTPPCIITTPPERADQGTRAGKVEHVPRATKRYAYGRWNSKGTSWGKTRDTALALAGTATRATRGPPSCPASRPHAAGRVAPPSTFIVRAARVSPAA